MTNLTQLPTDLPIPQDDGTGCTLATRELWVVRDVAELYSPAGARTSVAGIALRLPGLLGDGDSLLQSRRLHQRHAGGIRFAQALGRGRRRLREASRCVVQLGPASPDPGGAYPGMPAAPLGGAGGGRARRDRASAIRPHRCRVIHGT